MFVFTLELVDSEFMQIGFNIIVVNSRFTFFFFKTKLWRIVLIIKNSEFDAIQASVMIAISVYEIRKFFINYITIGTGLIVD